MSENSIDHFVAKCKFLSFPFCFFMSIWFISFHLWTHKRNTRYLCSNSIFRDVFFHFFFYAKRKLFSPKCCFFFFPSCIRRELKIKTEKSNEKFPRKMYQPVERRPKTIGNFSYVCTQQTVLFRQMFICELRGFEASWWSKMIRLQRGTETLSRISLSTSHFFRCVCTQF